MKYKTYPLLFLLLLFLSCKHDVSNQFLVTKIRDVAQLSTTEVVVTKVVWSEMKNRKNFGFLSGKRVLLFDTEATFKYGIDLKKIQAQDIQVSGDTLRVLLPPVELLNFSYPHEKFRQINPIADFDGIKNRDKIKLLDEVFRGAEIEIKEKAKLLDLEAEARNRTVMFLETFLGKLGYENIVVEFKEQQL